MIRKDYKLPHFSIRDWLSQIVNTLIMERFYAELIPGVEVRSLVPATRNRHLFLQPNPRILI